MLPTRQEALYTPPSSPPSPPFTWVNSSSAPSSPIIEPLSLDNTEEEHRSPFVGQSSPTVDPLSGSYSAHRAKLARTASISTYDTPLKKPRLIGQFSESSQQDYAMQDLSDYEGRLWEEQVENAFHTGERRIELTGRNLTEIPSNIIKDLSNIVMLPESKFTSDDIRTNAAQVNNSRRSFNRFHTSPGSPTSIFMEGSSQKKTQSSSFALGISNESWSFYVGKNNISRLPQELWTLQNLTILSLRNNHISYLPPEIGKLRNLESLNVASNNLSYLPAELMALEKIKSLVVFPNPFIPPPEILTGQSRPVSQTKYTWPSVPPLTELALRVLFSRPQDSHYTVLEQVYNMPLATGPDWRPISRPLKRILATCAPGSVIVDKYPAMHWESDETPSHITGVGQCPNPKHGRETHIFVQHAEERYSWEKQIAGHSQLGGDAPLLWRGCQRGCLDFLGPQPSDSDNGILEEMEISDNPVLQEEEEVVQAIYLGSVDLSFDDE